MPWKKYALAPSSAAMIQGYAQQVAEVVDAHHASQSRHARRLGTSAPPTAAAAASSAAVAANTVSTLNHSSGQVEKTGRWTSEEHRLFLQGLEQYGKGWKKITTLIKSQTVVQIRTHAQKYFQKLAKARQNGKALGVVCMGNYVSLVLIEIADIPLFIYFPQFSPRTNYFLQPNTPPTCTNALTLEEKNQWEAHMRPK